jgi:superfamily II DNA helicase RecQ
VTKERKPSTLVSSSRKVRNGDTDTNTDSDHDEDDDVDDPLECALSSGSVIIYVWRQMDAESVAENLVAFGAHGGVVVYHGGMDSAARSKAQSKVSAVLEVRYE